MCACGGQVTVPVLVVALSPSPPLALTLALVLPWPDGAPRFQFGFLLLDSTPDQLVGQYISNRDGKAHDYFEIPNVFGGGEGK